METKWKMSEMSKTIYMSDKNVYDVREKCLKMYITIYRQTLQRFLLKRSLHIEQEQAASFKIFQ